MVIDKLVAQSSSSICHCQGPRLFRFGAVFGKMGDNPIESWKNQIQWYSENNYFNELNRTDGKPMEFEWKIFPGHTTAGILKEIQKMMGELQCDPANFTSRIIFMSMFNDLLWDKKENEKVCEENSRKVGEYAQRFPCGHWSFLGPGSEKKWSGTHMYKVADPMDLGIELQRRC